MEDAISKTLTQSLAAFPGTEGKLILTVNLKLAGALTGNFEVDIIKEVEVKVKDSMLETSIQAKTNDLNDSDQEQKTNLDKKTNL